MECAEWEGRAQERDVLSGKVEHNRDVLSGKGERDREMQKLGRSGRRPINK